MFLLHLDQALISENGCVSVEDYLADATEFIHDRQFDNQVAIFLTIHSIYIIVFYSQVEIAKKVLKTDGLITSWLSIYLRISIFNTICNLS